MPCGRLDLLNCACKNKQNCSRSAKQVEKNVSLTFAYRVDVRNFFVNPWLGNVLYRPPEVTIKKQTTATLGCRSDDYDFEYWWSWLCAVCCVGYEDTVAGERKRGFGINDCTKNGCNCMQLPKLSDGRLILSPTNGPMLMLSVVVVLVVIAVVLIVGQTKKQNVLRPC